MPDTSAPMRNDLHGRVVSACKEWFSGVLDGKTPRNYLVECFGKIDIDLSAHETERVAYLLLYWTGDYGRSTATAVLAAIGRGGNHA